MTAFEKELRVLIRKKKNQALAAVEDSLCPMQARPRLHLRAPSAPPHPTPHPAAPRCAAGSRGRARQAWLHEQHQKQRAAAQGQPDPALLLLSPDNPAAPAAAAGPPPPSRSGFASQSSTRHPSPARTARLAAGEPGRTAGPGAPYEPAASAWAGGRALPTVVPSPSELRGSPIRREAYRAPASPERWLG